MTALKKVVDVSSILELAVKFDLKITDVKSNHARIENLKSINDTNPTSLSYVSSLDYVKATANTLQGLVLLPSKLIGTKFLHEISCSYIALDNPKYFFACIYNEFSQDFISPMFYSKEQVEELFSKKSLYISDDARIARNVEIGSGAVIHGNVFLLEKTIIGSNVVIKPNTTIGGDGFGYATRIGYPPMKIPHFGGVVIGDNVDIGSSVNIDRGVFSNTVISDSVKIDNGVHIAHNVRVGERSLIIANSEISGSVVIGSDVWIAPSVSIREKLKIGSRAFIGLGSVVTKDVEENAVVFGVPAKPA
jgi:UDP-3-O-[3-hydroxymyristoyl] glucosamine N-acyltransferase